MSRFFALGVLMLAASWSSAAPLNVSTKFFVDGDSIPAGTGDASLSSNYWNQVFLRLSPRFGLAHTNLADPGDMIEDLSAGGDIVTELSNSTSHSNVVAFIQCGLNNIAVGDSVAAATNKMHTLLQSCRSAHPGLKIILGTILNTAADDWDITRSNRVDVYNSIIRSNWFAVDYIYDPVGDSRLVDGNNLTYFSTDQTHPNAAGYTVMADHLENLLTNNWQTLLIDRFWVRSDGNDSNSGTTNSSTGAFRTVQKAADVASMGDLIYIQSGYYPEQVTLRTNASQFHPIRFIGSGTNTCTNGAWVVSATNNWVQDIALNGTNQTESSAIFVNGSGDYFSASNVCFKPAVNGAVSFIYGGTSPRSAIGCRFERVYSINASNFVVGALGADWVFTNFTIINSNGWDAFRVHCDNAIISGGTMTLANPTGNENHPDFFQSFPSSPNNARGVIVENVMCIGSGSDDVQMGNFSDDGLLASTANWIFRNCVFVDVPRTINLVAPGFSVYHSTFVRCATGSGSCITITSNSFGVASNTTIVNNIFADCGTTNNNSHGWYGGDNCNRVIADYNLVTPGKPQNNWTNGVGGIVGPFETHGLNGYNPLFVNASSDFRLQTGSAALNAGTNLLSLVATDILGASRDSTPSLGAYEAAGGAGGGSSAIQARTGNGRPVKPR